MTSCQDYSQTVYFFGGYNFHYLRQSWSNDNETAEAIITDAQCKQTTEFSACLSLSLRERSHCPSMTAILNNQQKKKRNNTDEERY
jgi:hypothetical protein